MFIYMIDRASSSRHLKTNNGAHLASYLIDIGDKVTSKAVPVPRY